MTTPQNAAAPAGTVEAVVRLNRIIDRLERVAELMPKAWDIPEMDEAQRIVMEILCEDGRRVRAGICGWKNPNHDSPSTGRITRQP